MARFIIAFVISSILTYKAIDMGAIEPAIMFLLIAIAIFVIVIIPEFNNRKNDKKND